MLEHLLSLCTLKPCVEEYEYLYEYIVICDYKYKY